MWSHVEVDNSRSARGASASSPGLVGDEVIAWATFSSGGAHVCSRSTRLYAVDFETCTDLLTDSGAAKLWHRSWRRPSDVADPSHPLAVSAHRKRRLHRPGSIESIRVTMLNGRPVLQKIFYKPWLDTR